jgi:hypothetical protein
VRQVAALVALRARTARGPAGRRVRLGLGSVPVLFVAAAVGGTLLPTAGFESALLLMPTALLAFAIAAMAATVGGGGRALLSPDEAATFPVTPGAEFLGSVLLAPLNVAWLVQALGLVALTGWVAAAGGWGGLLLAEMVTLAWLASTTVLAQAIGYAVDLARTSAVGLWSARALLAVLVAAAAVIIAAGRLTELLNRAPTTRFVAAAVAGSSGGWRLWAVGMAQITALGLLALPPGVLLARRLRRRPARPQVRVEARDYPTHRDAPNDLLAGLRVDRAGVWRSAPLRRGLVALAAIPGLAACAAGLDWPLIVLLPGLVTSGAGLLYGVNALSLDGKGAIWRHSLPESPNALLTARMLTVTETCLAGAALVLLAACLRAPGAPTMTELAAVAAAVICSTAQVVSHCLVWSLSRPYAAGLRDARDQPAPPAAMAGYSARLAVSTTVTALLFSILARVGATAAVLLLALAVLLLAARRCLVGARLWNDGAVRSRVVATVAGVTA